MAHRLYSIPMSKAAFDSGKKYIIDVARKNGYSRKFIDRILHKHHHRRKIMEKTSLEPIDDNNTRHRISTPHCPPITNRIKHTLKRHNIDVVTSTNTTFKSQLCSLNDKSPPLHNAGIYQIKCDDCDNIYIGQTRRRIEKRIQEHVRHTNNRDIIKSSVADHMITHQHNIDQSNIRILKRVRKYYQLDAYESLHITNSNSTLMNTDDPPIVSPLLYLSSLTVKM